MGVGGPHERINLGVDVGRGEVGSGDVGIGKGLFISRGSS